MDGTQLTGLYLLYKCKRNILNTNFKIEILTKTECSNVSKCKGILVINYRPTLMKIKDVKTLKCKNLIAG